MFRYDHDRYTVDFWMNQHNEMEVRIMDTHYGDECVAHLVEKDEVEEITEDGWYSSMFVEAQQRLEEGYSIDHHILRFENIDRGAPEYSENTLYWKVSDKGYWWARHPLDSWQSMVASGEFIEWEVLWGEEKLEEILSELRADYMEMCKEEAPEMTPA